MPFRLSWNALLMSDINLERYVDAFARFLFSEHGGTAHTRSTRVLARFLFSERGSHNPF